MVGRRGVGPIAHRHGPGIRRWRPYVALRLWPWSSGGPDWTVLHRGSAAALKAGRCKLDSKGASWSLANCWYQDIGTTTFIRTWAEQPTSLPSVKYFPNFQKYPWTELLVQVVAHTFQFLFQWRRSWKYIELGFEALNIRTWLQAPETARLSHEVQVTVTVHRTSPSGGLSVELRLIGFLERIKRPFSLALGASLHLLFPESSNGTAWQTSGSRLILTCADVHDNSRLIWSASCAIAHQINKINSNQNHAAESKINNIAAVAAMKSCCQSGHWVLFPSILCSEMPHSTLQKSSPYPGVHDRVVSLARNARYKQTNRSCVRSDASTYMCMGNPHHLLFVFDNTGTYCLEKIMTSLLERHAKYCNMHFCECVKP